MPRFFLCHQTDITESQCKELVINTTGTPVELFLVRHGNRLYAYQNHCPHTGVNLNWQPDQFLDITGHFLQCSTHGALFRIHDGECIRGPCLGQSLPAMALSFDADRIYLEL